MRKKGKAMRDEQFSSVLASATAEEVKKTAPGDIERARLAFSLMAATSAISYGASYPATREKKSKPRGLTGDEFKRRKKKRKATKTSKRKNGR